jgi:alkanesulfonate monooxygenase SsuD/methylene tetrahydromethanopterin reductase-like flavin-dependent oxidoreductase (luciferase family)
VGRLSESLQIIKSLWTQERTSFAGRYYQLKDAIANPKPVQKPHPPIWIGASGESTLRLVARHADVWNAAGGGDAEKMKEMIAKLEAACGAIGRDPSEIRRSLQFGWDGAESASLLDESARYLELGFTEQVIYLRGPDPGRVAGKVAELLPELRRLQKTVS